MGYNADTLIDKWSQIPSRIVNIILSVIFLILYLAMFVAFLLIVWGAVQWISGWNEVAGKKNIVRGVVLFIITTTFIVV